MEKTGMKFPCLPVWHRIYNSLLASPCGKTEQVNLHLHLHLHQNKEAEPQPTSLSTLKSEPPSPSISLRLGRSSKLTGIGAKYTNHLPGDKEKTEKWERVGNDSVTGQVPTGLASL